MKTERFDISGMSCAACVARIEKTLNKIDGIESAAVNLANETATVTFDDTAIVPDLIVSSIERIGYGAALQSTQGHEKESTRELQKLKWHLVVSVVFSAPLFLSMAAMLFGLHAPLLHDPVVQFAAATVVQFFIGFRFYRGAFHGIRARSLGMDVLVALGTTAAYSYSIYNGIVLPLMGRQPGHLYFESSAAVITLVLLGKYLEARARGKTSEAISRLMRLSPKSATVVVDGVETTIALEAVKPGDVLLVRPGERVPVDGVVLSGESAVDESIITGESIPADKAAGDGLIGGTINSYGSLTFRAEKVGKDTVLARIIEAVNRAVSGKPPIQRFADRVAGVFVPVIIAVSIVTLLVWIIALGNTELGIVSAVAVLVIACPCALGLATPTAVMVGTGLGAGLGILIRNGDSIEAARRITMVVLDKTSTVTMGAPAVTGVLPADGIDRGEVLRLAGAAEKHSEHPVAKAVAAAALEELGLLESPDKFEIFPGMGARASLGGNELLAGSERFMREMNVDTGSWSEKIEAMENRGNTSVLVASNGTVMGLIAVADTIKPSSPEGVRRLRDRGVGIVMVTGDNERVAASIAGAAGIDRYRWGVMPEEKAGIVARLQEEGHVVAMAGDGVNDSPALARADIGISMGTGTDIAIESSDITILNGDLRRVADFLDLSGRTIRKIRQNFFWAFVYNIIGVPVAALGLLSPVVAGAAMAMSSVSVVGNSLLLKLAGRRYRISRAPSRG